MLKSTCLMWFDTDDSVVTILSALQGISIEPTKSRLIQLHTDAEQVIGEKYDIIFILNFKK